MKRILKHSENAIKIIQHYESCRLKAYKCPAGYWTIGWGFTYYNDKERVKEGDVINLNKALALLDWFLEDISRQVDSVTRDDISQNQFDALVDFVFNCGIGNLKNSTLLKLINKDPNTKEMSTDIFNGRLLPMNVIQKEFLKWDTVKGTELKGLTKRRSSDWILYNQGIVKLL